MKNFSSNTGTSPEVNDYRISCLAKTDLAYSEAGWVETAEYDFRRRLLGDELAGK